VSADVKRFHQKEIWYCEECLAHCFVKQVHVLYTFAAPRGVVLKTSVRAEWRKDHSIGRRRTISPSDCGLRPRELEIVEMIGDRDMNKGVGDAFTMCERPVKHHLTNTFNKGLVSGRLKWAVFDRERQVSRRLPAATLSRIPSASE